MRNRVALQLPVRLYREPLRDTEGCLLQRLRTDGLPRELRRNACGLREDLLESMQCLAADWEQQHADKIVRLSVRTHRYPRLRWRARARFFGHQQYVELVDLDVDRPILERLLEHAVAPVLGGAGLGVGGAENAVGQGDFQAQLLQLEEQRIELNALMRIAASVGDAVEEAEAMVGRWDQQS